MTLTTSRLSLVEPQTTDAFGGNPASGLTKSVKDIADRLDLVVVAFDQGVFSSRPTANAAHKGWLYLATDQGRFGVFYYCTGTAWIVPEPWVRTITDPGSPGFAPIDGDEVVFAFVGGVAEGGRTIRWKLRYDGAVGIARRWVPEGCRPLFYKSDSLIASSSGTIVSGALPVPGPGRYRVQWSGRSVRYVSGSTGADKFGYLGVTAWSGVSGDTAWVSHFLDAGEAVLRWNGSALLNSGPIYGQEDFIAERSGQVDILVSLTDPSTILNFDRVRVTLEPLELGV